MLLLVYSLCALSILKIVLDLVFGEAIALYSLFIETLIFAIVFAMIVRGYFKQKEGRRERLQRKIESLNQALGDVKL